MKTLVSHILYVVDGLKGFRWTSRSSSSSYLRSYLWERINHRTDLLQPHIGNIRDSTHFVSKIQDLSITPEDKLVSFDVVSLFRKVPLKESLECLYGPWHHDYHVFGPYEKNVEYHCSNIQPELWFLYYIGIYKQTL